MMPGVAYYLSTWYKGDELALRIGLFGELNIVPEVSPPKLTFTFYSLCGEYQWCLRWTIGIGLSLYTSNTASVSIVIPFVHAKTCNGDAPADIELSSPYGRWRNVFLIEGVLTITCAFIGYLYLPRSPERSKFLTEKERSIAIQRLARENHGAVSTHFIITSPQITKLLYDLG
jgi:hypothetical protein